MSRDIAPFGVRMPQDLKTKLENLSKENKRSLNAEIVTRLQESLSSNLKVQAEDTILHITRYKSSPSTYRAKNEICEYIVENQIQRAIFAVRDGENNKSAVSIILYSDKETAIFDTSMITAERRPREAELYSICDALDQVGAFPFATFVTERVEQTKGLPPAEAIALIAPMDKLMIASENVYFFLEMFCKDENIKEVTYSKELFIDDWKYLCGLAVMPLA